MAQTGGQAMIGGGNGPDIRADAVGWVLNVSDPDLALQYNQPPRSPDAAPLVEQPAPVAAQPDPVPAPADAQASGTPLFDWPVLAGSPAPAMPVPDEAPLPVVVAETVSAATMQPEDVDPAPPSAPDMAAPLADMPAAEPDPAPPLPPQPVNAQAPPSPLLDILPHGDAMRVFAMELAIQAYDAPALPVLPGGFSAEDLAAYYAMVRRYRPGLVVEFGGGNGTPMASAALEANGRGKVLRFAAEPIGLPRVEHASGIISALTAEWAATALSSGDMLVIDPSLPAADMLHILGNLLPASRAGLYVQWHGGSETPGLDAELAQALASDRRVSVLFATAWHAAHNRMALDALVRGRAMGQGGSLWFHYRPA